MISAGFIKICGITSIEDAQMVAQSGASALGLIVASSKRQISLETAERIARSVDDFPVVLVVRHMSDEDVLRATDVVQPSFVQVHDELSTELQMQLRARNVTVITAISSQQPDIPSVSTSHGDIVMIDGPSPGSGQSVDWRLLASGDFPPFILAGGLTPENVSEAIRVTRPLGVDVASGVESSPGVKSALLVEQFVNSAKMAYKELEGSL